MQYYILNIATTLKALQQCMSYKKKKGQVAGTRRVPMVPCELLVDTL